MITKGTVNSQRTNEEKMGGCIGNNQSDLLFNIVTFKRHRHDKLTEIKNETQLLDL